MTDYFQGHELILTILLLLLPMLSFLLSVVMKSTDERIVNFISNTFSGLSFLSAFILSLNLLLGDNVHLQLQWFTLGEGLSFNVGLLLDELTAVMLLVVTFVSFMVHLFSSGYMSGDSDYGRYFGLLGLFTFSMLGVVLADNLLFLFVFWELVGFTSYLLIGFWYARPAAVQASKKAFLVNRIGDLGFVITIMILWSEFGNLDFIVLQQLSSNDSLWMDIAGIGLLCGVMGKSAQFPLQVWLPDAMEGPTPVSALIHAATMVAAGIFLLARIFLILSPTVLDLVAIVGAITAFMGAIAAINQYDIKKVLAFSTISQLGYMVMGIGVGAKGGAVFHLVTHAFFKACLFLSAGAVIHWMHQLDHEGDIQDMRSMGGLRKYLPVVFITFSVSAMSLAGLPLFSGFLSKDAILTGVFQRVLDTGNTMSFVVAFLAFGSVILTAFYMTRQVIMIFFGESRSSAVSAVQSKIKLPISMSIPLMLLSIGGTWLLFSTNPLSGSDSWIMTLFASDFEKNIQHSVHLTVSMVALILSMSGITFGYLRFRNNPLRGQGVGFVNYINQLSFNNWFLDRVYKIVFVNSTLKLAQLSRYIEVKLVDRLVNYIGIGHIVLSRVVGWGDRYVVDGMVHLTTSGVNRIGKVAMSMQGNNAQRYIMTALISMMIIAGGLVFYLIN